MQKEKTETKSSIWNFRNPYRISRKYHNVNVSSCMHANSRCFFVWPNQYWRPSDWLIDFVCARFAATTIAYSHGIFSRIETGQTKQLYCISPPHFFLLHRLFKWILTKENINLNIKINCSLWSKCATTFYCYVLRNQHRSNSIVFLNISFEIECAPERDWNAITHSFTIHTDRESICF